MMGVACVTTLTMADLAQARTLAQTVRAAHPDWSLHAVIVDLIPTGLDPAGALSGFDRVVTAEQLGIPSLRHWLFQHGPAEACAGLAAPALADLLAGGNDAAVCLDFGFVVLRPLAGMMAALDTASVVLTPRFVTGGSESLAVTARLGIHDMGCIAVRGDGVGRNFVAWWAEQAMAATDEDARRLGDLVPSLFDRVQVLRDLGCGVAPWNLPGRTMRFAGGDLLIDGAPVTAIRCQPPSEFTGDNTEKLELWRWYDRQVAANRDRLAVAPSWGYGAFSDGEPIPSAARALFRNRPELRAAVDDPFDAAARRWMTA